MQSSNPSQPLPPSTPGTPAAAPPHDAGAAETAVKPRLQPVKPPAMYQVHTEGRGVCGIYTRDIAQTKTHQVMEAARTAGHPLQCIYEPVPE